MVVAPCTAHADDDGERRPAAEAAFRSGSELMARGNVAEACASFEQSRRLEPTLGTVLRLADCYETMGRTASAWALFVEARGAAVVAGNADQERLATERAHHLEQRLSKIVLHVEESVEGEQLKINGVAVPAAGWGSTLPVDPGLQHIEVSAPGHSGWAVDVDAEFGPRTVSVHVPRLNAAVREVVVPTPVDAAPKRGFRNSMRTIGLVTGTVGLGGVALGGVFAAQAYGASTRECRKGDLNGCNESSTALKNDARAAATRATIAFVAGGALLAAGVTLLVLAPAKRESHALFQPRLRKVKWLGTAGLTLQGEF